MKKISIVTPCYNEEDNIATCVDAVSNMMSMFEGKYEYEHILTDNASTDGTVEILDSLARENQSIKVLVNSRNIGPFRNMWSGMKHASGDAIIPFLPADLQDPVSVIPEFISRWESGDLIVYGVRRNRQESFLMRMARGTYYRIIRKFSQTDIPLNVGEFLLADKKVLDSVLSTDDEYPYVRGLFAQTAVRASFVEYNWEVRKVGKSKNSFLDLVDQGINGFVSTNKVISRLALLSGFIFALIGILMAFFSAATVLINRNGIQAGIPTIIVGVFFLGGIQLIFLGIIGEYVLSIHSQVRKSPAFFIAQKINL
jgi:glycosyltransferase involved in cell wall biosynthesis